VILAKLRRQVEIGGQKSGTQFGDKFLHCVTFIGPALATEFAVEARWMARPVGRLQPLTVTLLTCLNLAAPVLFPPSAMIARSA
jgi:hypothetical protein